MTETGLRRNRWAGDVFYEGMFSCGACDAPLHTTGLCGPETAHAAEVSTAMTDATEAVCSVKLSTHWRPGTSGPRMLIPESEGLCKAQAMQLRAAHPQAFPDVAEIAAALLQ